MTGRIIKKPGARQDLVEHFAFIARDNREAAERFLLAAAETFDKLAQTPGMGRLRPFNNPQLIGLRSWHISGFKNYLVFYRPFEHGIDVIRVLHGAQDIDTILEAEDLEE